jgi:hypothetical protein
MSRTTRCHARAARRAFFELAAQQPTRNLPYRSKMPDDVGRLNGSAVPTLLLKGAGAIQPPFQGAAPGDRGGRQRSDRASADARQGPRLDTLFMMVSPGVFRRGYDEFFVQLELTFALALTETLMLADALTDASAAVPAHAIALPPRFADVLTTACPVAATFSSALAAS